MNLLKQLSNYFKLNTEFSKNVLTILSGSSIAQIIPFIVSPVITRIYLPEDFGILSLFVSIVSIFSIIVTFQYDSAIVLPKTDKDAAAIVYICIISTIIVSLLSLFSSLVFKEKLAVWLGNENIKSWVYWIPIPIFFTGIYNTFNSWAIRVKKFKRITFRTVSQSITTNVLKIILGLNKFINGGLIIATIIGQVTATIVLTFLTLKDEYKNFINIESSILKKNIIKYKNFPLFTTWHGFLDILNTSSTTFIISSLLGPEVLGYYSFTLTLLIRPLNIIGSSISMVYYQKATELYNEGKRIWLVTKKIVVRLFIISIFIFIPILIAGPKIFTFIFGYKWYQAGIIAQVLIPLFIIKFIGSPITNLINILGKQNSFFLRNVFINVIYPALLFIFLKFNIKFEYTLFFVSFLTSIYYIIILFWIKDLIHERDKAIK